MTAPRHFLDFEDIPAATLQGILAEARRLKAARGREGAPLAGKTLAMIFEKSSTRTRVSFEVAMHELGGHAITLNDRDTQLGRGESVADTARVLSRYVHAMMLRCHRHETLRELAAHATVPIINGLSNRSHPCQVLADILTFEEHAGQIAGKTLAWVGDGNNMARTFITAAVQFGFSLRLACPARLMPPEGLQAWAKAKNAPVAFVKSPEEAVAGADAVITDTWVSMGDENAEERAAELAPYQVNAALMARAKQGALFLHCLPAHRGEEVTPEVIDGPHSVVWDEAENRLHVQKAILMWCFNKI